VGFALQTTATNAASLTAVQKKEELIQVCHTIPWFSGQAGRRVFSIAPVHGTRAWNPTVAGNDTFVISAGDGNLALDDVADFQTNTIMSRNPRLKVRGTRLPSARPERGCAANSGDLTLAARNPSHRVQGGWREAVAVRGGRLVGPRPGRPNPSPNRHFDPRRYPNQRTTGFGGSLHRSNWMAPRFRQASPRGAPQHGTVPLRGSGGFRFRVRSRYGPMRKTEQMLVA